MKHVALAFILHLTLCPAWAQPSEAIYSRTYTYLTLSPYQKQLFDDFLTDEIPAGKRVADVLTNRASLRNKTRLAEALLFRNKPGDKENAAEILRWILNNQYRDENTTSYGIWKTSIDGDNLDQNWREFIGCDLIIIRKKYSALLPDDLRNEIEVGLTHAAKGALKRNVSPDYTNISIMSSFLMEYVGTEFKIDALRKAGMNKAHAIFDLFQRHHTFSEYNSPTYYGVTLVAIALWRELAFSPEMRQMGQTLEREFWHEVSTVYQANLKNMVGPYFRGYGMDMQKYVSIMGLWIAIAVDNEKQAPLPPGRGPKYGEISNLAPIFNLGLAIPNDDLAALKSVSEPRLITRTVPNSYKGDSVKSVTAMISRDWMMGGVWGNRRGWNQIKTGTLHWKTADGDIGWLLIPGTGQTNVNVSKTTLSVYRADPAATTFAIYVYAPGATTAAFSGQSWAFASQKVQVQTSLKRTGTEPVDARQLQKDEAIAEAYQGVYKLVYEIPADWDPSKPMLQLSPSN